MLQVLLAPLSYNAGVVSRSSVAGQRSAAPQMVKSESLPFMEEPAHLSGMVGNVGFDPMGLSTPQNIKWMREAELKHGRICMLAWVGWVAVDLGVKFPGAKYAALSSYQAAVIKDCICPRAAACSASARAAGALSSRRSTPSPASSAAGHRLSGEAASHHPARPLP